MPTGIESRITTSKKTRRKIVKSLRTARAAQQKEVNSFVVAVPEAIVTFDQKISSTKIKKMGEEIINLEGVHMVLRTKYSEIIVCTKLGDDVSYWQVTLPKIKKIVKKHLTQ